jgi:hypothetical protein
VCFDLHFQGNVVQQEQEKSYRFKAGLFAALQASAQAWLALLLLAFEFPRTAPKIEQERNLAMCVGRVSCPLHCLADWNSQETFTTLRPLTLLPGGIYTWGGTVSLNQTTVTLTSALVALGHETISDTLFLFKKFVCCTNRGIALGRQNVLCSHSYISVWYRTSAPLVHLCRLFGCFCEAYQNRLVQTAEESK